MTKHNWEWTHASSIIYLDGPATIRGSTCSSPAGIERQPTQHLDGPAKEYSSSTCNNPARLEPNDGAWFMHDASFRGHLYSLLGTTFWSGTHDFSLDGAHRFSGLCLRVAIAILTCMSMREKGGEMGEAEISLAYDVRVALKAYGATAKAKEGSLAAGITFTERRGAKRSEGIGKGGTCSRHAHDYHHGGDGAAEGTASVKGDFPFRI